MRGKWRECSADMEVKSLIGFWGDLAARRSYLYGNRATKIEQEPQKSSNIRAIYYCCVR
jgi:hypothetical protein